MDPLLPEDMDADMMAGPDMMDIMKQTASQLNTTNTKRPDLLPQSTMNVTNHDNALIGRPLNYQKSASPNPGPRKVNFSPNNNAITAGPTINLGGYKEETPMMFDDENYDVKDDLTKEQQKDVANVEFARQIQKQMDRMADDVANVDPLEQQYRMTMDPENPNNIFVLKFGKNEEQHWKLPWNSTTSLMCHMEPNKLLIEQSKYNAIYIKYSLNPPEWKRESVKAKQKQILKSKQKAKRYKVKLAAAIPELNEMSKQQTVQVNDKESRPPTTKFSEDMSNNPNIDGLTAPSNNNLLAPMGNGLDTKRGTFLVNNSMLIHSDKTADNRSMTDQELLVDRIQHDKNNQLGAEVNNLHLNKPSYNTLNTLNATQNPELVTPITAQIRPELVHMAKSRETKGNNLQNDPLKPEQKQKTRRVSLASVNEEEWKQDDDYDTESVSESDDDDDEVGGNKANKRQSKLHEIKLSVAISNHKPSQQVQRLNSKNKYINYSADAEDDIGGVGDEEAPTGNHRLNTAKGAKYATPSKTDTADITGFSPPKITLETWLATEITKDLLYLGDEWDALNYMEIMDNSIEYFINCAAGYCAFDHETKLKQFWLDNWKLKREQDRNKKKEKAHQEREKRRRARLKKFQREHPEWKPREKQPEFADDGSDDMKNETDNMYSKGDGPVPDLNNVGLEEFAMFVGNESPSSNKPRAMSSNISNISRNKSNKQIIYRASTEQGQNDLEYFKENRDEFSILDELHRSKLDLEIDDSEHSSMYDSCLSSEDYGYDSEEFDEFVGLTDQELIDKLCPFKFLNIYAHNWEGYRILDLHMNDVWNFIEECRVKNVNLKKEWRQNKENMEYEDDTFGNKRGKFDNKKPPHVSCLIFCTKNNIPMTRIKSEMDGDPNYTLEAVGRSICTITDTYKQQQIMTEDEVWDTQIRKYNEYQEALQEMQQDKITQIKLGLKNQLSINYNMDPKEALEQKSDQPSSSITAFQRPIDIKNKILSKDRDKKSKQVARYEYKYWSLPVEQFWEDFETLKSRDSPLNRLFATSSDRSITLTLGYEIHSGMRLKQTYKAIIVNRPNSLRNQSFLRQLIQLDWMKHIFEKPGMRKAIPYRDEYDQIELDEYLSQKKHYQLR